ncbi:MAG: aminoacyl-tRNA hydrolase [Acidobacteria bacterium RIFCSPLOWO2_02_FULL_59_13]|nr:MAG: aminoacyl-tRNA hydrolase [Acidobacteria bacterium RIFCSPLOWO2_02_FULL_59_13]
MKLVVGLGNPGPEYDFSPHNLGFAVVDRLAERGAVRVTRPQAHSLCARCRLGEEEVWLVKPQTYMNRSGIAVREWLDRQDCGPQDLIIIADDLDLPWGQIRIRPKGSAGGHHGLESVMEAIGSQQFTRVRMGVQPEREVEDPVRYLLSPVGRARRAPTRTFIERAAEAVEMIVAVGTPQAMNVFNRKEPPLETASQPLEREA